MAMEGIADMGLKVNRTNTEPCGHHEELRFYSKSRLKGLEAFK